MVEGGGVWGWLREGGWWGMVEGGGVWGWLREGRVGIVEPGGCGDG